MGSFNLTSFPPNIWPSFQSLVTCYWWWEIIKTWEHRPLILGREAPFQSKQGNKCYNKSLKGHSLCSPKKEKRHPVFSVQMLGTAPRIVRLSAPLKLCASWWNSPCLVVDFTERDGRCYLLLAAVLLCSTKRQATTRPPSLFTPSMSHCFSRTGRRFVQKQAPCLPPHSQK